MRLIFLCICLFINGCTSTVNLISDNPQVKLPDNMGYVLIPVYRNTSIYQLRISGSQSFKFEKEDLKYKKSYLMIQLPEGEYSYSEIRLNKYTVVSDFESGLWDFNVKKGVINYAGHFIVHDQNPLWNAYNLSYEIQNNSSIALEYLEKKYPYLTQAYPIFYSGPGEDDFFSYINSTAFHKGDK